MPDHIDRQEGRRLFGLNPQRYDEARPDYPPWIYQHLREIGALVEDTATLEIGAGSGRATRRLLEYGANPLTIIEPDERFAPLLAVLRPLMRFDECSLGANVRCGSVGATLPHP
jgi:hypothetical protein